MIILRLGTCSRVSKASKAKLERYAVILSRPHAYAHVSSAGFPQMCETVRILILVRISEESNREATSIAKIALWISLVALLASVVQAGVEVWSLIS
jgi:hypothetical protein